MNHDMWENKAKEVLRLDNNNEEEDLVETVDGAAKKPNSNNLIEPIGNIADQINENDKNINNNKIEKEQPHDVDYDDDNSKNNHNNNNNNNNEIENKHIDDNGKPKEFIKLKKANNRLFNNNGNNENNKNLSEQT